MNTHFTYPGFFRRLGTILYDMLIMLALFMIGTWVLLPLTDGQAISPGNVMYQLYLLLIVTAYYTAFWVYGGQTLGMRAWRIRVLTLENQPLSWKQALKRAGFAVLTLLPAGCGLWWALFQPKRQALYDQLAHTQVVMTSPQTGGRVR